MKIIYENQAGSWVEYLNDTIMDGDVADEQLHLIPDELWKNYIEAESAFHEANAAISGYFFNKYGFNDELKHCNVRHGSH